MYPQMTKPKELALSCPLYSKSCHDQAFFQEHFTTGTHWIQSSLEIDILDTKKQSVNYMEFI